ncbi:hypothetical protein [Dyella sp.]|uniref:hypothetical protein n=1 Tax=Dyella sp. TaxID=1869338 RepID=UPI002ED3A703
MRQHELGHATPAPVRHRLLADVVSLDADRTRAATAASAKADSAVSQAQIALFLGRGGGRQQGPAIALGKGRPGAWGRVIG